MRPDRLTEAIAETAALWREPDYAPRIDAVKKTLGADNRFTREALAFGINHAMSSLTLQALQAWIDGRRGAHPCRVGVIGAGNVPLVSLQDFLAVVLTGHEFVGCESSKSPWLLPLFVDDVRSRAPVESSFCSREEVFVRSDALIATGSDETRAAFETACDEALIEPSRRLLRGNRFGVAVIDGRENENERVRLAEDILMHEGLGCRNVAILFAPESVAPDDMLQAMAVLRGTFSAHEQTKGTLKMQQAFLAAVGVSHAHGEGMEFLVSRGEPEVQHPGHLRWTAYQDVADVTAWLGSNRRRIQVVAARPAVGRLLPEGTPLVSPGSTQRPALGWLPDGTDVVSFLTGLGSR